MCNFLMQLNTVHCHLVCDAKVGLQGLTHGLGEWRTSDSWVKNACDAKSAWDR